MGKVRRLTHEEVEEVLHRDELSVALEKGGLWVRSHVENVVIGVVVLAAAIFGIRYYFSSQADQSIEAAKLLYEAHQLYQRASSVEPAAAQQGFTQAYAKYQGVAQAYQGTPQAMDGRLGMANSQFAMGKYDEAKKEFDALSNDTKAGPLAALAAAGSAACLEAKGQFKEAAAAYKLVASRFPQGPNASFSLKEAARLEKPL